MNYSQGCRDLVKRFEGCKLTAYADPGTGAAPFTVGYGHTVGVHAGMKIVQAQAERWLEEDLQLAADVVSLYVEPQLTQSQFDALTDFVYNVGRGMPGHRDGFVWLRSGEHSTILKLLNAGCFTMAADEFEKWNLPPLPGIITRRQAERSLFLTHME